MARWFGRKLSMGGVLLALLAMLFVAVPAVEALACAPEDFAKTQLTASSAEQPRPSEPVNSLDQHGLCAHGHCHDGQTGVAHQGTAASADLALGRNAPPARLRPLASLVPDGLKRPPRA